MRGGLPSSPDGGFVEEPVHLEALTSIWRGEEAEHVGHLIIQKAASIVFCGEGGAIQRSVYSGERMFGCARVDLF